MLPLLSDCGAVVGSILIALGLAAIGVPLLVWVARRIGWRE